MNDYYVGHVMSGGSHGHFVGGGESGSSYTCIGAPVGQGGFGGGGKEVTVNNNNNNNEEEGLSWGRSYAGAAQQHRLDPPSSAINRFQDGF